MAKFLVEYPIAGSIRIEVDAENEEAAKKIAFDRWTLLSRDERDALLEWEVFDKLVDGTVIHASCTEATATPVKEG